MIWSAPLHFIDHSPQHWNEISRFCGHKRQSPINIVTSHVKTDHNLLNFTFINFSSPNVLSTIENNKHTGTQMCLSSPLSLVSLLDLIVQQSVVCHCVNVVASVLAKESFLSVELTWLKRDKKHYTYLTQSIWCDDDDKMWTSSFPCIVKVKLKENEVEVSGGGLNDTYSTSQFHFHWGDEEHHPGSEHLIDGYRYPMEVQYCLAFTIIYCVPNFTTALSLNLCHFL